MFGAGRGGREAQAVAAPWRPQACFLLYTAYFHFWPRDGSGAAPGGAEGPVRGGVDSSLPAFRQLEFSRNVETGGRGFRYFLNSFY